MQQSVFNLTSVFKFFRFYYSILNIAVSKYSCNSRILFSKHSFPTHLIVIKSSPILNKLWMLRPFITAFISLLFTIQVSTFKNISICKLLSSLSMRHIVFPISIIYVPIFFSKNSFSTKLIIFDISFVIRTVLHN